MGITVSDPLRVTPSTLLSSHFWSRSTQIFAIMDAPEPDQTPFAAVSAQTSRLQMRYQTLLDKSTPYVTYRWVGTVALFVIFALRILLAQGWYVVAYALAIYLLNLFLAFLTPKFDPSNEAMDNEMEDGSVGALHARRRGVQALHPPSPGVQVLVLGHQGHHNWLRVQLVRDLQRAGVLACTADVLVHAGLPDDAQANSAHDQVPLRPLHFRKEEVRQERELRRWAQRRANAKIGRGGDVYYVFLGFGVARRSLTLHYHACDAKGVELFIVLSGIQWLDGQTQNMTR